jgi:hypothetical protein
MHKAMVWASQRFQVIEIRQMQEMADLLGREEGGGDFRNYRRNQEVRPHPASPPLDGRAPQVCRQFAATPPQEI